MGKIIVVTGPMFSGKSTEVLRLLERYCLAGKKVSYYIPDIDSRTSKTITISSTRGVYKIHVNKLPTNLTYYEIKDSDVIAFDEVQFFSSEIISLCQSLKDEGKIVIVSGLDMDYLRRPFGEVGNLMAIADEVVKLTAICECGAEAQYTQRLEGGNKTIVIGDNYYTPRCGNCYEEYIHHLNTKEMRCINNKYYGNCLTLGKIYNVEIEDMGHCDAMKKLIDAHGEFLQTMINRFEEV